MSKRAFPILLALSLALPAAAQSPELVRVTAEFQAWADVNRDGTLQMGEREQLVMAALGFFTGPHPVTNELDSFLDANRDGRIGQDEIDRAWVEIVLPRLERVLPASPEAARFVDANNDGEVDADERRLAAEYLLDRRSREPHAGASPIDGRIDANHDGWVGDDEIAALRERLVRAAVFVPMDVLPLRFLDELADANGNGVVEPGEARERETALARPHAAWTGIDRRLDANGDGWIDQAEIDRALETQQRQDEERVAGASTTTPAPASGPAAPPAAAAPSTTGSAAETTTAAPAASAAAATPAATTTAAAGSTTSTATASTGMTLEQVTIGEIFPVFRSYYDDHPIGTAVLKNGGSAAIENVKIDLELKGYMDAKKPCAAPTTIAAGATGTVELTAVFNDSLLRLREGTKALATVTVSWTTGGKPESKEFVQTVRFLKLNAMTWDDDDRAAAFVTANDPVVLQFRSAVVTNVDRAVTAVDAKLRTAMALHQTLVKYGLKYWPDPNAAYETISRTKSAVDTLQFPAQTIQLKTGDCDDLAILASALLECAGVESAFVTVPGHIFVAFALAMTAEEAKKVFVKPDDLIFKDEKAWVPWEITALSGGFLKAWERGAQEWRASSAKGEAGFHPLKAAWKKYQPFDYSAAQAAAAEARAAVTLPSEAAWTKDYTEEVKTFINQQIATRVQKYQGEIKNNPSKPEPVNGLGVLYARYGLLAEAEKEFLKLDKQAYVPALVNLGNLAFLKPDMKAALGYYGRACAKEATNAKALLGLARANHELENYGSAQEAFAKLKSVDASLAAQYAYLDLQGTEADQAAKAGNVVDKVEWVEK